MKEKSLHCTLTDHELAAKADQWIDELIASGGESFAMHVPARPNSDTDLILAELNNRFKKLILQPKPAGAVWVKANIKPTVLLKSYYCRLKSNIDGHLFGKIVLITLDGQWQTDWEVVEWLDESGTAANELPAFWDVAKAFKWAAEYRDEIGGHLTLYNDQWTLISEDEDGNENETEDLTPGNVAELYCLQNGFTKEIDESPAAAREEDAVSFADWANSNYLKCGSEMKWMARISNSHEMFTTAQLYELFKQQKENP